MIVTEDRRLQEVIQLAKTIAPSKATVLVQGESGTGKELMAQLIHDNSNRAAKPFIAINCAAIPENLLESELFGFERGAFTGAVQSKSGKFELAHTGTLLLDEISEMDIRLQAKLLRVIQKGEVDRVGSRKTIPVDVRIIATTNRNLAECVRSGAFREDLFYRLNVVNLTLPPLRERLGDIRRLALHFLHIFGRKNQRPVSGLSESSYKLLESHDWPGNVRELENVMERAVLTARSAMIQEAELVLERKARAIDAAPAVPDDRISWLPGTTLNDIERNIILDALSYHKGNRTHTARALGISIRTLRNKLADYRRLGIDV